MPEVAGRVNLLLRMHCQAGRYVQYRGIFLFLSACLCCARALYWFLCALADMVVVTLLVRLQGTDGCCGIETVAKICWQLA